MATASIATRILSHEEGCHTKHRVSDTHSPHLAGERRNAVGECGKGSSPRQPGFSAGPVRSGAEHMFWFQIANSSPALAVSRFLRGNLACVLTTEARAGRRRQEPHFVTSVALHLLPLLSTE